MIIASYAALALALQILENIILPPQIIWLRIGIANIITLLLLYKYSFSIAVQVTFIRILIASILLGSFLSPVFWMSFVGGMISVIIMGLVIISPLKNKIGVVGLSIIGAISHNLVQLYIAALLLGFTITMMPYLLPIVTISGIAFGAITGYIAYKVMK